MNRLELDKASVLNVMVALLADELKSLRHLSSFQTGSECWDESTLLGELHDSRAADPGTTAIGADSLELLSLATCVAKFFNLYDSGLEDYLLRFKTLGEWADLVVTARLHGSKDLTFATSGSTGAPKHCLQRWDTLVAETTFFAEFLSRYSDQPMQRVMALSPCHHIYGFIFSVLLPAALGLPAVRGLKALTLVNQRKLQAGDLIIGFPFIWRQLSHDQAGFPAGITAVTSTGPCDPEIIFNLRSRGLDHMIEVYGSSETSGVGVRSDPDACFKLLPRWQRGLTPDALTECGDEAEYRLSDQLVWFDQTSFRPTGRIDAAVQVAGINVFPLSISERLKALPEVADATVRLMSVHEGDRLKAFIVPTKGHEDTARLETLLHTWCMGNLPAVERPKAFTFGSALPLNHLGKQSDWSLERSAQFVADAGAWSDTWGN
ncbi:MULTISPECIES: AMP-binding protein [Pseudomonas]|uniref:AMP-binding protein n=1 Tax=Pseudomonas TaxID=286 RepID=UPI001BE7683A|nr:MULTISPECIES: AMP-binding protein [Pseudomonas]MBT2339074.1 AMP-binding protein [Pseudomonas fluorescens]MCD4528172.1 AMP-binding protein [Pseudomonas sp. C3-2018]